MSTFEFQHKNLSDYFEFMKQGTSEYLIEKSSIDFLEPYISLIKIQAKPQVINQQLIPRFTNFDDSEIF